MNLKIRLYIGERIQDVSLENPERPISIGSSEQDTVKIVGQDIIPNHLNFVYINGEWVCQNYATRESKNIANGDIIVLSMKSRIAAAIYSEETVAQSLELRPNSKVLIGRNVECMFYLPDKSVGRKHAELIVDEMGATIRDLKSLNGTFVNHRRISEAFLRDGDIISVGKYSIRYQRSMLELCVKSEEKQEVKEKTAHPYPEFNLSPRLRHQCPSEIIEIKAPPSIGNMPMVNWLSFLPMLASRSAYSAIFPLTSVFSTFLEKKKYKEAKEVRQEKYERYLEEVKAQIDKNREDQFLSLEESNHETSRCYEMALRRDRTLWERSPEDDDFMKVRIGKGDVETSFRIKFPDNVLKLYSDDLENQGEELGKGNQILEGAPILCDLVRHVSVGIIGDRERAIATARNMMVQLSTTHSYKDLKIVTLFSKKEAKEWEFAKWIPHAFSDSREMRYVANDVFKTATIEKVVDEELKNRKQIDKEEENTPKVPFYLFVVSEPELIEETEIENYLDNAQPGMGIGAIYVYPELKDLPKTCNIIIDVKESGNEVFHKSDIGQKQVFEIDDFSREKAEAFARSLAPVRLAEKRSTGDIPTSITFLEGYGVDRVEELPIWDNWNNTNPGKSMAVPLGVKAGGDPFMFNMMYGSDFLRYHGSHGLLAGTNGSGKSEMLQSWILSMAVKFPPSEVSFVIIDYKGTGLLRPFENLPHLAGKFSNIDGNVRRNIISINEEMKRRQVLFDQVGIHPEIKEYFEKGYHKTIQPLPVIVLVIDEFAEITKNLPNLVPVLESIFTVGRSLGIWAIVSTQRPSGVVTSHMYANSKFRWCCRVASSGDSKEMLRHTDAAKIRNAGRAYVQVGEDDIYEQVQSYWSGAPYHPESKEKAESELPISQVDIIGKRIQYESDRTKKSVSAIKEIDAVVAYIKNVAEEHGIQPARQLWKKPLPGRIYLDELQYDMRGDDFVVPYGMIDNPYTQSQYAVAYNFSEDGHCLVYGLPGTGKTTFLQTCIMSIARNYSPEEVNLYALDFGSWSLNLFANLPHMGGIANDNDKERIDKLIDLLTDELDGRKRMFAMNGVINVKSYNQIMEHKIPNIVLVVDNFQSLFAMYPELEDFFIRLVREGANYGVYLLATTGTNSGISFKVTANMKSGIALQMKDKTEYDAVVGKTNGLMPDNLEGRGIVREGAHALEFQTALCSRGNDEGEQLAQLKVDIADIREQYRNVHARQIPIMPDVVSYGTIGGNEVILGLECKEITPVELDFKNVPHYVVISGQRGSGVSNITKVILKQFYEKKRARIVVYDPEMRGLLSVRNIADRYLNTATELDAYMEEVKEIAEARMEQAELGQKDFQPIVIAIENYREMYEAITDLTAKRLSSIVNMCEGLGIYLVVSDNPENLKMLQGVEPIMRNMIATGTGILTGGTFYSHYVFTSGLSYTESQQELGEFEAYMVCGEKTVKFKTMYEL